MLPVNQAAIDSALQPAIGPDGKRKEHKSNVLLATIENMQYAVPLDVLHSVFSAFGFVQKVAMFDKNGHTHALIQYPDLTIAAAAKETLEGHCIYDGGYCKLHLTYSRHTDLNVKAFSDKSRDYTVLDPSLHAAQAPAWQTTQAATMYSGSMGQMPSWDPNQQEVTQSYLSAPGTFPSGQAAPPFPGYSPAAVPPAGASPHSHMPPSSFAGAFPGSQPHYGWESRFRLNYNPYTL
ncbi:polypyrimidine tract-binding protein homolog 1 [Medicago truncatula]|nr:polypyrimidine tract-binding protein homolog 1 [Medicago truncatula]